MNFLHFSDLHGKLPAIPTKYHGTEVIVILSGDICDNYPDNWIPGIKLGDSFTPMGWRDHWNFRKIDFVKEAELQNQWIETVLLPYLTKCNIKSDNVIAIRGNHDWADFEKYFGNSLNVGAKNLTLQGIKFGLLTGVPQFTGEWFDEIDELTFENRIKELDSEIEILVTHSPPYGILDRGHGQTNIGSPIIYKALFGKSVFENISPYFNKLRFHLFGHAHDARGAKHFDFEGRTLKCYNASQTRFELEF
jgi:Icc-related predicted phosphoesterase